MEHILYGAAYYDEYMPYDRLETDMEMMKKAGINVIRIAESTWSTEEPEDGIFCFEHITRVLEACEKHGISVIVGTPTYAIPAWMAKKYPEVMVTNRSGRLPYGARQIMDITHPVYRFYCERIIRKLMEAVQGYSCVIGYQLDNETKHFGTCSENVQQMFVSYMRHKFHGDLEALNNEFGLDYWSNRINTWEEFPSMVGTINGSLGCEFEKFQREQVTQFLKWQEKIVREYKKENQFITHNFDFAWKGHSYGVQPDVDHNRAADALTIAGCDIYHPSQEQLTGKEIAFCGDMTRSLKKDNYMVIETEAQGFPEWTPYPGQLRLQAFSHLASGADSVMYWHWHSIHNACETYWKGILSHDLKENSIYREVSTIGNDLKKLGDRLVHLKKKNSVAIMVSNEALTAMKWFPLPGGQTDYNSVVRWIYDALYEMNIECDMIWPEETDLSSYEIIFAPALYSVKRETLERLKAFAADGGTLVTTFKSCFTNEHVRVWAEEQPAVLQECMGIRYDQFTKPENVYLTGDAWELSREERQANVFMELATETTAEVIARYDHYMWKEYVAVTRNTWQKGICYYLACMTTPAYLKKLIRMMLEEKNLITWKQDVAFPVIIREGITAKGETVRYYLNYSGKEQVITVPKEAAGEILLGEDWDGKNTIRLKPWGFSVIAASIRE